MKHIKLYEQLNVDIDPFGEEQWELDSIVNKQFYLIERKMNIHPSVRLLLCDEFTKYGYYSFVDKNGVCLNVIYPKDINIITNKEQINERYTYLVSIKDKELAIEVYKKAVDLYINERINFIEKDIEKKIKEIEYYKNHLDKIEKSNKSIDEYLN